APPRPRFALVGWLSQMSPADAAQTAIDRTKGIAGTAACVLHIDRASTRMVVYLDRDTPVPPNTCALGIRFDSNPDFLAEDLADEAVLSGIAERDAATRKPRARADARRYYAADLKARVVSLIESGVPVQDAAEREGVPYKSAWRWARGEAA
ncbi:MAG: hypothetical protein ACRCTO_23095, partial [Pseudomonas paracarnis]